MEVVAEAPSHHRLREGVAASGANFVIAGVEDADVIHACGEVLAERRVTAVLAVEADGRRGFLYDLRAHGAPFGEVSPEGLLGAIRAAAPEPPLLDPGTGAEPG